MVKESSRRGRTGAWTRVAVVLAAAAVFVGLTGVPAQALTSVTESFETSGTFTWDHSGSGSGMRYVDCSLARTGCGGVVIRAATPGGWWATSRTWFISAFPDVAGCTVEMYAKRQPQLAGQAADPPTASTTVRLEVINPSTWTYIAKADRALTGTGWTRVGTGFETSSGGFNVVVRTTLVPGSDGIQRTVNIDDLRLSCILLLEGRG